MKKNIVFVTGGAGFIGSNFVRYLLKSRPEVHVVVFDKLTYSGNLENLASLFDNPRFSFVQGDICDISAVQSSMNGCTSIVHFAAESHVDRSIATPKPFVQTNIEGTFTLLEAARILGIERFIHISTDEVYGDAQAPDSTSRPSIETDALKPASPYAASKASADCLAFSYWATFRLPVVITRCSNNYGPYQYPEKQLPLFIINGLSGRPLPVYGDGYHRRSWIYVDDHCAALMAILMAPLNLVIGEIFNIGTDDERSILENAQAIISLLGLSKKHIVFVPDRLGHVHRHAVDTSKLRERLAWIPQVSFHEGLLRTITWYSDNKGWLERVLERPDTFLTHALKLGNNE